MPTLLEEIRLAMLSRAVIGETPLYIGERPPSILECVLLLPYGGINHPEIRAITRYDLQLSCQSMDRLRALQLAEALWADLDGLKPSAGAHSTPWRISEGWVAIETSVDPIVQLPAISEGGAQGIARFVFSLHLFLRPLPG